MKTKRDTVALSYLSLVAAGLVLIAFAVWSDSPPPPAGIGGIEVLGPSTLQLGSVSIGDPGVFSLRICNRGDAATQISRIWTTCGCTVVQLDDPVLAPNQEATIVGTVDTRRMGKRTADIMLSVAGKADAIRLGTVTAVIKSQLTPIVANPVLNPDGHSEGLTFLADENSTSALRALPLVAESNMMGCKFQAGVWHGETVIFRALGDGWPKGRYYTVVTVRNAAGKVFARQSVRVDKQPEAVTRAFDWPRRLRCDWSAPSVGLTIVQRDHDLATKRVHGSGVQVAEWSSKTADELYVELRHSGAAGFLVSQVVNVLLETADDGRFCLPVEIAVRGHTQQLGQE